MLEFSRSEATGGIGKLERPEEVIGLLEVRTNCVDLVYQIFHAYNIVFSKTLFDQLVVSQWYALFVDLAISAFVNKLSDRFQVWVTVSNVGVYNGEHLRSGLRETDEDTIVDL